MTDHTNPTDRARRRLPMPHPAYQRLAASGHQTATCPDCDATRACCQCRADVGDLRRFARRMAELHQHTGTPLCGCGAHHCYIRRRLDDIGPGRPA